MAPYYRFASFSHNEWERDEGVCFIIDSLPNRLREQNTVFIEITHNINYRYQTLFLDIQYGLADSTVLFRDTLECELIDSNGFWEGSGNGPTRQFSQLFRSNLPIILYSDTALHNEICIRHAMQDYQLKGIERIGIKID